MEEQDTEEQEVNMNMEPVVIRDTKESLDAANVWARALLVSLLGPEEGGEAYRTLPALPVLLAYRRCLDVIGVQ